MMRSVKFFLAAILIIVLSSCENNEALFKVDTFMDFTIPLGLNTIEAHYFVEQNVPVTLYTQLEGLNIEPSQVTQVVACEATLLPRFNSTFDLDFIQSVNVFILEDINDLDSDTEIFFLDVVPLSNRSEIRLFSTISDVSNLLRDQTVILATRLEFRQFPPATFDMRLELSFGVYVED